MTPELQIVLSGALTFGAPLALAVRELLVLRRPAGGATPPRRVTPPAPPPQPEGDAPALKPLPACLIPTLSPTPVPQDAVRELEPV